MQDILFGFLLLSLAVLLFVSVVLEWGTILISLLGVAFLGVVFIWMAATGDRRRRR
jgi:thiol:disulfide interchange protein